jgi:outer membrane protein assembly factor BamB
MFKRYTLFSVLVFLALSLVFTNQIYGSPAGDWPVFRHDTSHTGFSESNSPTTSVGQLWNQTVDATASYSPAFPVVSGGFVYVETVDVEKASYGVSCFKSSTGVLVWNFPTGGYFANSPAVYGDRVYVASADGYVHCLYASNGAQVWNYFVGESLDSPVNFAEGKVFVESSGGNVYCLDTANGDMIWNYSTGGKASALCPAVANGYVFVSNNDGNFFCLDATNGSAIWNFTADGAVGSPSVAYGLVYFGSKDGNAYCVNASNGDKVWNYTTWYNNAGPSHNYHWGNAVSDPAVAYGYVYVGSSDFDVFCLNASTGNKIWNFTSIAEIIAAPAVAEGCVYTGSYDGNVYCLNASSGVENWRYVAGVFSPVNAAGSVGSPVIANGEVYVVGNGVLSALGSSLSVSPFSPTWVALVAAVLIIVAAAVAYTVYSRRKKRAKPRDGDITKEQFAFNQDAADANE